MNPHSSHRSPRHPGLLMSVLCLFAAEAGTAAVAPKPPATPSAAPKPLSGQPDPNTSATATGTGTGPSSVPEPGVEEKTTTGEAEVVTPNVELVDIIRKYDAAKEQANNFLCDMAEYINKNNVAKPILLSSIMEARGCTYDTAQGHVRKILALAKDPQLIKDIRAGVTTVRETFQGRKKPSKGEATAAQTGSTVGGSVGTQDTPGTAGKPEKTKQEQYDKALQNFVKAAKALGIEANAVLLNVKQALKEADVK